MIRVCWVLLLACYAGAGWAAVPEPDGFRMEDYRGAVPDTVQGGVVLHTEALRAAMERGEVVLVDVLPAPRRPAETRPGVPWMPVPHRNLPGSVWWPDVGRGALGAGLEARFKERVRGLAAGNPGRVLVFYCLDQCWLSWNAARRAAGYGVAVGWYPEGADGWIAAGLATQEGKPEFLDESP